MRMRRIKSLKKKPFTATQGTIPTDPLQEQVAFSSPHPPIPQTQQAPHTPPPNSQQQESPQKQPQNDKSSTQLPSTPGQDPSTQSNQTSSQSPDQNKSPTHVTIQKVSEPSPVTGLLTPDVAVSKIEDDQELFRVKSYWLLDLFPNELIIRQKSLHVIIREFLSSNIETMMVDDVSLVQVNNGLIFSSLVVSYRIPHDDLQIAKIPKAQAMKAKAILDSLMVSKRTHKSDDVEVVSA